MRAGSNTEGLHVTQVLVDDLKVLKLMGVLTYTYFPKPASFMSLKRNHYWLHQNHISKCPISFSVLLTLIHLSSNSHMSPWDMDKLYLKTFMHSTFIKEEIKFCWDRWTPKCPVEFRSLRETSVRARCISSLWRLFNVFKDDSVHLRIQRSMTCSRCFNFHL